MFDGDPETQFLKQIGLNSSDDAKPTGAQLHKALKYFSLGVKLEVTLHEISYILVNISLLEITLILLSTIFMSTQRAMMDKMASLWLFMPHLVRGITGFILN